VLALLQVAMEVAAPISIAMEIARSYVLWGMREVQEDPGM
jgi:hypothetical protein